jgi:hypothetical protein
MRREANCRRIIHRSDNRRPGCGVNGDVVHASAGHIPITRFKEMTMKKTLYVLALLGLFASTAVYADDAATKPKATKAVAATKSDAASPASTGAEKPVLISQQDKMRLCAKQATGKKGAERKAFMKSCLSKKA